MLCWGANAFGQVGDGTTSIRSTPTRVLGLPRATAIAVGSGSSCALLADRTVQCWGLNREGQLGDGVFATRSTPAPVVGLGDVAALSGLRTSVCALRADRSIWCWGSNYFGEAGTGATSPGILRSPVQAQNLSAGRRCAATTGAPVAEVCDGIDNDCNGVVDDPGGAACP